MHRYLSSFIITTLLYTSFASVIFYVMQEDLSSEKIDNKKDNRVKISLSSQRIKQVCKQEEVVKKKPEKKEIKKVEKKPEKIVKKVPKPVKRVMPIAKKVEVKPPEQKVEKEESKKCELSSNTEIVKKRDDSKTQLAHANQKSKIDKIRKKFLVDLREKINKNKRYPKRAISRRIEGSVDVKFTILPNGEVSNIVILSGKRIFSKAVKGAIQRSFPLQIPKELDIFPLDITIKLDFKFS